MNLFDQPPEKQPAEPQQLDSVEEVIKQNYPLAWRIDHLQTVIRPQNPDTHLTINRTVYRIWTFMPFIAFNSKKLIIYYKEL